MSTGLWQFLTEVYIGHAGSFAARLRYGHPIQIDDQDDSDPIVGFCNIFVTVGKRNRFDLELLGAIPVTQAIQDLAEIYDGYADRAAGRIVLRLDIIKIEAISDIAERIRATARLGASVGNPHWDRVSARTISSLRRFMRVIREFQRVKGR